MSSSLLNSLDMSLDDLIEKKKAPRGGAREGRTGGGGGPVRKNRANAGRGRRNAEPYSRKNDGDDDMGEGSGNKSGKRASILSRLGGRVNDDSGHKIFVQNLKFDVLEDDLKELFGTVGKVNKAEIVYDRSGRSKGLARVWFTRRSDAEQAIKRYDGRLLDDQAMKITLDDGTSAGNQARSNAPPQRNNSSNNNDSKNVRKGVFGTALDDNDEPKFNVTFEGRRNGRRGRRGRGGNRGNASAEDLDNDMDTYHADN